MKQILVAKATKRAHMSAVQVEKRLIGEVKEDSLIEYRGQAYIAFNETDIALEMRGTKLLAFAIEEVRA